MGQGRPKRPDAQQDIYVCLITERENNVSTWCSYDIISCMYLYRKKYLYSCILLEFVLRPATVLYYTKPLLYFSVCCLYAVHLCTQFHESSVHQHSHRATLSSCVILV